MRKDELYNVGGFDPKHPSRNVLDEFVHDDAECGTMIPGSDQVRRCACSGISVRHYDKKGRTLVDRRLTADERRTFFPPDGAATIDPAVKALANESVSERIG